MAAFNYTAYSPALDVQREDTRDLDSAFNDGYCLKGGLRDLLLRWLVIGWCVTACAIGSYMMVESLVHSLLSIEPPRALLVR